MSGQNGNCVTGSVCSILATCLQRRQWEGWKRLLNFSFRSHWFLLCLHDLQSKCGTVVLLCNKEERFESIAPWFSYLLSFFIMQRLSWSNSLLVYVQIIFQGFFFCTSHIFMSKLAISPSLSLQSDFWVGNHNKFGTELSLWKRKKKLLLQLYAACGFL